MILFYQDEAQETKFQKFLPSLDVCTGQKKFFQINPMKGSYRANISL